MKDLKNILDSIKYEIDNLENRLYGTNYGTVIEAGDGIVKAIGLDETFLGEVVEFVNGSLGIVMKIDPDTVSIIIFNSHEEISQGCKVLATGKPMFIKADMNLLGRVIDPLGNVLDGMEEVKFSDISKEMLLEAESTGVMDRSPICDPLQTGISLIDLFNPIGLGQKQLILGDRQTGKTAIAIDTILNQSNIKKAGGKFAYCIYVSIAKKASEIAKLRELLKENDALDNTIIITTTASDASALQYIAPMSGVAIAEYFRDNGMDALVILDDLTQHADSYREISLLMRRTPAREAYPGDVFYLHSRLLERAVKLKNGGSVTILPIIETKEGDVASYIPTNVISITDGQLYLDKEIFNSGQRPAINIGLSVSRIGSAAQHKNIKKLSGTLKGDLAQYVELKNFAKSVGDLDSETKKDIAYGDVLMNIFKQRMYAPLNKAHMILILICGLKNLLLDVKNIQTFSCEMFEYMKIHYESLLYNLNGDNDLTDSEINNIVESLKRFKKILFDKYKNIERVG